MVFKEEDLIQIGNAPLVQAAMLYGVVDVFGGSIEKGVGKGIAKVVGKEVVDDFLNIMGKEITQFLKSSDGSPFKNSFVSGNFTMMEAVEDITVYRFSSNGWGAVSGEFFSLTAAKNATAAKNMLALRFWDNTGKQLTPITIKKGTQFAFGPVAGGYGYQIFIPEKLQPDNIIRQFSKTITLPE